MRINTVKSYLGLGCYINVTPLVMGYEVEVDEYLVNKKTSLWAICLEEVFNVLDKHGARL